MDEAGDNPSCVQCDASLELVGEIDQAGLDALAGFLIAAARRRVIEQSNDDAVNEENYGRLETS